MKSKIMIEVPGSCGDCEFYQDSKGRVGPTSGLCLWRVAPVHYLWSVCEDRLGSPQDLLKRQLVIASQNYLRTPRRRKKNGESRQDSFL